MQIVAIAAAAVQLALGAGQSLETAQPKVYQRPIDVVFMIDVSGSMRETMEDAKKVMYEVASSFRASAPLGDLRVGILLYGQADKELGRLELTSDLVKAEQYLMSVRRLLVWQEFVPSFIGKAVKSFTWNPFAAKHVVAVGNELPQQGGDSLLKVIEEARRSEITTSAIWCNWHRRDPNSRIEPNIVSIERKNWMELAQMGGGFFLEIDVMEILRRQHQKQLYLDFQRRLAEATVQAQKAQLSSLRRQK